MALTTSDYYCHYDDDDEYYYYVYSFYSYTIKTNTVKNIMLKLRNR